MYVKGATLILATMLLALLPGCTIDHTAGCGSCHYRPGKSPMLTDSEFGYHPTVWKLWPGPLDPNTSYPSTFLSQPATVPFVEPTSKLNPRSTPNRKATLPIDASAQSAPITVKDILEKKWIDATAQSAPMTVKDILERNGIKPPTASK
jgi:hypothetical protein